MSRDGTGGRFALVTVLFGTVFPAIQVALAEFPPLTLAALRYALSAIPVIGYAALRTDGWRPRTRADGAAVLAGGTLFIGGTGFSFVGQQRTTGGVAAVVFSLIPILTTAAAWLLLPEERPSRKGLVGVLVGFLGVALVVGPAGADARGVSPRGTFLVLLGAASVALGTVLVHRCRADMSVVALTGWAMLLGAAIQAIAGVALGESPDPARVSVAGLAALLYLAWIAGSVGFVAYFTLIERIGPLETNLVAYLNPPVALLVGHAFLAEPVTAGAVVGFVVITAGFLFLKNREIAAELARYRGAGR